MKFERLLTSCLALLLFAVAPAFASSSAEQDIVVRDQKSGLLSIQADNISLTEVMERVSAVTGLIVKTSNPNILNEYVTINLKDVSLKQVVDRLLYGVNSVFFYSSKKTKTAPKLTKVMLLSRKEGLPAGVIANSQGVAEKNKLPTGMNTVPGRFLLANNYSALRNLISALKTKEAREQIAKDLGSILLNPAHYSQASNGHIFYEALKALKQADSKAAEDYLTNLLESSDEAWVQSLAVRSLGETGGQNAVGPLITAFASTDPSVRNAAALSLARTGNSRGIQQLLQATQSGDLASQQRIVNALAYGDANSQAALSQAIASNQIPAEAVSEDVAYQLSQQNEN